MIDELWFWRTKDERYNSACLKRFVRFSTSVVLWCCVRTRGMGNIVFLKSTVTYTPYYVYGSVRESPCFIHRGSVWHLYGDEDMIFQQDPAPVHSSHSCMKKVKTWLQEWSIQVVLDWPANSLNLNIIEEVWNIMKRCTRSSHPASFCRIERTDYQHLFQHPSAGAQKSVSLHAQNNCCSHPSKRWPFKRSQNTVCLSVSVIRSDGCCLEHI